LDLSKFLNYFVVCYFFISVNDFYFVSSLSLLVIGEYNRAYNLYVFLFIFLIKKQKDILGFKCERDEPLESELGFKFFILFSTLKWISEIFVSREDIISINHINDLRLIHIYQLAVFKRWLYFLASIELHILEIWLILFYLFSLNTTNSGNNFYHIEF
jgi:hypothetical protein